MRTCIAIVAVALQQQAVREDLVMMRQLGLAPPAPQKP